MDEEDVNASSNGDFIWKGRVSQRLRSEWQPVWIQVTKSVISLFKSEVIKIIISFIKNLFNYSCKILRIFWTKPQL